MTRGVKIEVEGCDGAGQTSALAYLSQLLKEKGHSVLETREVGSKLIPTCLKLREIVLSPDSNMSGEAMELVFAAMRLENERFYSTQDVDVILSDRGWLSHLAYTDHNVSEEFTNDFYMNFLMPMAPLPDVVIYFDVSAKTAQSRIKSRGEALDAIELKGLEFQENVRHSFKKHMRVMESTDNAVIFTVDANQNIEEVQSQLRYIVKELEEYSLLISKNML